MPGFAAVTDGLVAAGLEVVGFAGEEGDFLATATGAVLVAGVAAFFCDWAAASVATPAIAQQLMTARIACFIDNS